MMVHTLMLADGLYIDMSRMWNGSLLYEESRGFDISQLDAALNELSGAVAEAKRLDEEESTTWWQELWERVTHLGGYREDRKRFDDAIELIIQNCDDNLALVQARVAAAREEADTPAKLEADSLAWAESAGRAEEIADRISAIQSIPGWQGDTSTGYQNTSVVQHGATTEFAGMAKSLGRAIDQLALFNWALFEFLHADILSTAEAIRGVQGGTDGYHYRRTANAGAYLADLTEAIEQSLQGLPLVAAQETLQGKVAECLEAPNILSPGTWPRGTGGRAGVPPATDVGDAIPDSHETDVPMEPPQHTPGPPDETGEKR